MLGANRADSYGPYGSVTWNQTPVFDQSAYQQAVDAWSKSSDQYKTAGEYQAAKPQERDFTSQRWSQQTQLSPEQQALLDASTQTQLSQAGLLGDLVGRVGETTSQPLDLSSLPELSGALNLNPDNGRASAYLGELADLSKGDNFSQEVADAVYGRATRYLEPQLLQQREGLEARLAEQGFVPGTPGYDRAMENYYDTSNRAYEQARDSSITSGYGQANTRLGQMQGIAQALLGDRSALFGNQLAGGTFQNQTRQQALQELLTQRGLPLQELMAVRGGVNPQMPGQAGGGMGGGMNPIDISGILNQNYQNLLGNYNTAVGSNNATAGSIAALLAALL